MSIGASITLGITIAGFIAGILWKVADLSGKFGKLTEQIQQNSARAAEDRTKLEQIEQKVTTHESSIAALYSAVDSITKTCDRIESKLDRLIERDN